MRQTIVTLAKLMSAAFTNAERVSEHTGWPVRVLKQDSPQWMVDTIHTAHNDMMPDDWRYEMIEEVADAIAELEDDASLDDCQESTSAIEPELYTGSLTAWLNSRNDRYSYCDKALEERSCDDNKSMISILQAGQREEYREISDALIDALEACADKLNEELDDGECDCDCHNPAAYHGKPCVCMCDDD